MLKSQIENTMRKSMQLLLQKMFDKDTLNDEDIDWIKRLRAEIIKRINNLTPRRIDLHKELESIIDIDFIAQMLKYSAMESSDFFRIINITFSRLEMLCAPSQDYDISQIKQSLLSENNISLSIASYILETNKIIDEIEDMREKLFKTDFLKAF